MDLFPLIAAASSDGFFLRTWKWLIGVDYGKISDTDKVDLKLLGYPEGWWLLFTIVAVAALVWFTFWLYRREGRTASPAKKYFLAGVRTVAILLALFMLLEPTLVVSKIRETLYDVIVMVDASESLTIDDLYSDEDVARGVADVTGRPIKDVLGQRIARQDIIKAALNNPELNLLNRLATKNPVKVFSFAEHAKQLMEIELITEPEKAAPPAAEKGGNPTGAAHTFRPGEFKLEINSVEGGRTYMGHSVRRVLETVSGRPLAAVIIIGDGQDNHRDLDATSSAGKLAAREGVPVYSVPVGLSKSRKMNNIRVDKSLRANRTIFVGDKAEFVAMVSSSGYAGGTTVEAKLFRQKVGSDRQEEVASERVDIAANASDQPVSLTHTPKEGEEGEYVYSLRIQPRSDEHLQQDNVAMASGVRVIKTSTNVLLISGSPTWEYRRLKSFLTRDRSVVLSCWLQSAGKNFPQVGDKLLRKLPETGPELFDPKDGYHVIILVDIDSTQMEREWFKLIEDFVENKAGGLLYVAGEKHTYEVFRARNTGALIKMIPVVADVDQAQAEASVSSKRWYRLNALVPTEDGLASPLLKFSTEREMTKRIWQTLPGSAWSFPIKKAKPAATVLLRTMDKRRIVRRNGKEFPMPVLVSGFYGSGRVAFMGFDESWRWRKLGTRVYETFWTQFVRSLVEGRLMTGKKSMLLETDNETYPVGSPVTITAKVFDSAGKPARDQKVKVKIEMTAAGGKDKGGVKAKADTIELKAAPNAPGIYKRQYWPARTGYYKLTLVGSEAGGAASGITIEVASQFEFDHPEANRVLLRELTESTNGGGLVELDRFRALPDRIKSKRKRIVERAGEFSLWDSPLVLGLLALLLGVEWAVRKRSNMA